MMSRTLRSRLAAFGALAALTLGALALSGCTAETAAEVKTYVGINNLRAQRGLPPLSPDPQLVAVARARSRDMAARDYFSHDPPDGCNFLCIMSRNGYTYAYAGENIAWNNWGWDQSADRAVLMWSNSPPHMTNILNCHYTRVGAGVVKSSNGKVYYTMVFEGNATC
jgi:uncharacterized protein YkwD